jgi:hypothetical protein
MTILHYILLITSVCNVEPYFIRNQNRPICANCKFFISNKNTCSKFGEVDIITGEYTYEPAVDVRNDEDKCGEYAIFFEKNYFRFITIPYYSIIEDIGIFVLSSYICLSSIIFSILWCNTFVK